MSEDPIGFYGGDVNLYRYVGNNSLNYVDPSGEGLPFILLLAVASGIYARGEFCERAPLACNSSSPNQSPSQTFPPFKPRPSPTVCSLEDPEGDGPRPTISAYPASIDPIFPMAPSILLPNSPLPYE